MTRLEVLEQRLAALETEVADCAARSSASAAQRCSPRRPRPSRACGSAPGGVVRPRRSGPPGRRRRRDPPAAAPGPAAEAAARDRPTPTLLGAFGLAAAGGIVTVLGIVFLFVLAANRGWIGARAARSHSPPRPRSGVFAAGFWLRRRFGTTHAALAAVGAGIAGAYATLLAATALYGFVPELAALAAAAGIAAVATVVALRVEGGARRRARPHRRAPRPAHDPRRGRRAHARSGTAFAALVFTAIAAVVALRERWTVAPDRRPRRPRSRRSSASWPCRASRRTGPSSGSPPSSGRSTSPSPRSLQLTSKAKPLDPLAGRRPARRRRRSRPARRRSSSTATSPAGAARAWRCSSSPPPTSASAPPSSGAPATSRRFFWAVGLTVGAVAGRRAPDAAPGSRSPGPARPPILAWVARGDARAPLPPRLGRLPPARARVHARARGAARASSSRRASIRRSASERARRRRSPSLLVAWFSRAPEPPDATADRTLPSSTVAPPRGTRASSGSPGRSASYAASLALIELFVSARPAAASGFERGQVAVTGSLGPPRRRARRGRRTPAPARPVGRRARPDRLHAP